MIENLTLFVTFNFLPWPTYSDFETAVSRRERVLPSNCYNPKISRRPLLSKRVFESYRSTCDSQLDLSPRRTHQLAKLITNALQEPQPVVRRQRIQEVLDGIRLVRAPGVLLELGHDLRLVFRGESGRQHDGGEFGVLDVDVVERGERFGGAV